MLYPKDLLEVAVMPKISMSIHKGREVEIYRSSDPTITGEYFQNDNSDFGFFELVLFKYSFGKNELFLRYPGQNYFIELLGSFSSMNGSMCSGTSRNIINEIIAPFYSYKHKEKVIQKENIEIYKQENDCMLKFSGSSFNFLSRIAYSLDINKYEDVDKRILNQASIDEIYNREYVAIPDLKRIEYGIETPKGEYFIVVASAYNYSYNLKAYLGYSSSQMQEVKIINFQRFRDGGTTKFDIEIDGIIHHHFHSPVNLGKEKPPIQWDGNECSNLGEETLKGLAEVLNIPLEHKVVD